LRDTEFHGWQTTAVLVEHVRALVAGGAPFVYAYYPGVDEVAHAHGLLGAYYPAELAAADALVGALLDALPTPAALLVRPDHGQVPLTAEWWVGLGAVDSMVETYAGDARFRYLHARAGVAADDLAAAATDVVGEHAWVLTRDQLLDEGWMGADAYGPARA